MFLTPVSVEKFDFKTNTWSTVSNSGHILGHSTCAMVQDKNYARFILVIGILLDTVYAGMYFRLDEMQWQTANLYFGQTENLSPLSHIGK